MKKNKILKIMAALLLSVIVLTVSSGCEFNNVGNALSDADDSLRLSTGYKFSDIEYVHPETDLFYRYADAAKKLCNNPLRFLKFEANLEGMLNEMTNFATMYSINEIYYAFDYTDEYCAKEAEYLASNYSAMYNEYMSVMQAFLNSRDSFIAESLIDEEFIKDIEEYVIPSENMSEKLVREEELIGEYSTFLNQESFYIESINGVEKTLESEIENYMLTGDRKRLLDFLGKNYYYKAEKIAPIYIELVNLRKELYTYGKYESAPEYYYDTYERDYTLEEAEAYCEYVKKYFVPVYNEIHNRYVEAANAYVFHEEDKYTGENAIESIKNNIGTIDRNLEKYFEYMIEYELYNVNKSDTKVGTSFTTYLMDYDEPFLFVTPDGTVNDYLAIIHEFGHFYEIKKKSDNSANLDVKEIHSQGLEILYTELYDGIFGADAAEDLRTFKLGDMVYAVIIGCVFDEFQRYAFSEENLTKEKLHDKYRDLLLEYGIYEESDLCEYYINSWVDVSHSFQAPFYYISYSVSAFDALQLYEIAVEESYDAAAEKYFEIIDCASDYGIKELSEECGLNNMFEEEEVRLLSDFLLELF